MAIPLLFFFKRGGPAPPTPTPSERLPFPVGASHYQGRALTILVYSPTISSYTPAGTFVESITAQINAYQHTINALGGYWSARFVINDRQDKIEDWLADRIGYHIEVYNPSLVKIFEGFVNDVSSDLGPLGVKRGPLMNVANKLDLVFSTVDTSVNPPATGMRERAGEVDDTTSQGRYGILQSILSSGGATATEAQEARNNYLETRKEPKTTKSLSLGRMALPSVRIEVLGYVHWLQKYVFNQTANTGDQDLDQKIQDVISADLNGIFDTGFERITANTIQVQEYENKDKKAWDIIKFLTSLGDTSDNRYLFGIYNDRVPVYEAAPTAVEYYQRMSDPEQRIETQSGERVLPWNVLPGKWLLFSDFLTGRSVPTSLRDDQRAMFIESATFTTPWGLGLQGGDTDKLSQKLAKLGMGGVGT